MKKIVLFCLLLSAFQLTFAKYILCPSKEQIKKAHMFFLEKHMGGYVAASAPMYLNKYLWFVSDGVFFSNNPSEALEDSKVFLNSTQDPYTTYAQSSPYSAKGYYCFYYISTLRGKYIAAVTYPSTNNPMNDFNIKDIAYLSGL